VELVRFLDGPRVQREMYDLASDPHELHSVARDPAYNEVQQRLERRLQELKARRGTDWLGLSEATPPPPTVGGPDQEAEGLASWV